jgi:phosphoribosylanthranilate isomerase
LPNIWIKICGITRKQDAQAAAELGASAIGLVMYPPSPRAVNVDDMAAILQDVPRQLKRVALFVNPQVQAVKEVIASGLVDYLQFHGNESPAFCDSFEFPYLKAFRVGVDNDLDAEVKTYSSAEFILLDAFDKEAPGGTGKVFDWSKAQSLLRNNAVQLVLAGGLNPDNVSRAIKQVRPFGVDVSTGVESGPGIKDFEKMKAFIEGARSV